jgi:hypothetical protein
LRQHFMRVIYFASLVKLGSLMKINVFLLSKSFDRWFDAEVIPS